MHRFCIDAKYISTAQLEGVCHKNFSARVRQVLLVSKANLAVPEHILTAKLDAIGDRPLLNHLERGCEVRSLLWPVLPENLGC